MSKIIQDIESPSIQEILEEKKQFYIPDFQRNYVWKSNSDKNKEDRHVNLLLEDVHHAMTLKFKEYYLGPIITFEDKKSKWEYQVIDGQQRITTTILFILAYKNFLNKIKGHATQVKVIDNLLFRDLEMSGKVQENEQFLKTSSIHGSKFLEDLFNGEDVSKKQYSNIRELQSAFKTCAKFIEETLEGNPVKVKKYFNFLKENCFFTWVKTNNFDEAFTIFERMNDRGLPLTTGDKLKHYILSTLIDDKQEFSKKSPTINRLWADIDDNLRSINFNFDRFIRYHLVARYWEDSYLTQKEVLPWFRSSEGKKQSKLSTNQIKFLESMKEDSQLLKLFKKSQGVDEELNPSLHFPKSYFGSVTQHLPVLFAAATVNDLNYFNKVAIKMEALIFIYSLADTKWNLLEKELAEICTLVRNNNFIKFENKINDLISKELDQAMSNLTNEVYLERNYMKSKFVLHRIDYEIGTRFKLDPSIKREQYTLEHIIPQNSPEGLKESKPPDMSLDDFSKLRHRIGNMTILSKSNNSIAGDNTPYQKIIDNNGKPALYEGTFIPMTKVLLDGKLENVSGSKNTKTNKFANKHNFKKVKLHKDKYWSTEQVKEREKTFFSVLSEIYGIKI